MKFYTVLALVFGLAFVANAQPLKYYQTGKGARIIRQAGDTLYDPWNGGFLNPQFSNIDLDNDGHQDLFVFEPEDDMPLTFMDEGDGAWAYAPEYAAAFPPLKHFALLIDYNKDGKADIFTYSMLNAGMDVYENISEGNGLKFKLAARQLEYQDIGFRSNIYVPSSDIPALADIDNDGDLDIMAYDVGQTRVTMYRNLSMDKYSVPDSLDYVIADFCWGKYEEPFDTLQPITLGVTCGKVKKRSDRHAGATMLVYDADDDGDYDMVLGDLGRSNLVYLENGRIQNGVKVMDVDSFISYKKNYPMSSTAVNIPLFPGAFLADVNADGKKDLLVSPQALSESQREHQVWVYLNQGSNAKPNFVFNRDNFLQNQGVSLGGYSSVTFWDYDGDGLKDMLVGGKGNPQRVYLFSKLDLYRNVGSASKPVYQKTADDFAGVAAKNIPYLMPAIADMDGDGKQDMILGQENGKLLFYKNAGTSNGIPQMSFVTDNYQGIDVGEYSRPTTADIDRDGLIDMVIGEYSGTVNHYKNTGTSTSPAFTLANDFFGHVRTNQFYYNYEFDTTGKPIDSTLQMESGGFSSPYISDVNSDGKWDMITGSATGRLFIYLNIEDHLQDSFAETGPMVFNKVYNTAVRPDFGFISIPAAADLDGDGQHEIVVGNYRGGFYYLSSVYIPLGMDVRPLKHRVSRMKAYPNPAQTSLTIDRAGRSLQNNGKIIISNSLGQSVYTYDRVSFPLNLDVSAWPSGIYFIQFSDGKSLDSLPFIVR